MKTLKRTTVLLAIMLFFVLQSFSQNAVASDTKKNVQDLQTTTTIVPGKFVDNNKDGICDNHQAKMKNGKCTSFVDKNGDGVCDNCKSACKGKGNSKGCGMGCQNHGQGKGNCCGNGNGCGCGNKHRNCCGNQNSPSTEPVKSNDKK